MRSFASLLTAFSFVVMCLSGLVAFIMPQGRLAYWNNWGLAGLDKTMWGQLHIGTSLLFLLAALLHLLYNLRPLLAYLRLGISEASRNRAALVTALLVTLIVCAGSAYAPPPFRQLFDVNAWVKGLWYQAPHQNPPFGHAELKPLRELCKLTGLDFTDSLQKLQAKRLLNVRADATLRQMALANGTSPAEIWSILRPSKAPDSAPVWTVEMVRRLFEGAGTGRKTLREFCNQNGLALERAEEKLSQRGWQMDPDASFKTVAARLGVEPITLVQAILAGEPNLIAQKESASEQRRAK
ncbi:MAG: DUF4405 domain-containing protein [Geothermobacteraceae bacterium]